WIYDISDGLLRDLNFTVSSDQQTMDAYEAAVAALSPYWVNLPMKSDLAQLACDRYDIADALHRYAFGLDHGDADSLASAFTEDCVFDFRPAGKKLGIDFPKLTGRQAIVDALVPFLGPLDTSHAVSN